MELISVCDKSDLVQCYDYDSVASFPAFGINANAFRRFSPIDHVIFSFLTSFTGNWHGKTKCYHTNLQHAVLCY
jgi:hypothetical protein